MSASPQEVSAFVALFKIVLNESERGTVIACSAYLEDQIKTQLMDKAERLPFETLLKILGSFVVQRELYDILEILREIRNGAAHKYEPFKLADYGQTFSNNFVNKASKMKLFTELSEINVNLPDQQNVKLGDVSSTELFVNVSDESFNFMMVTIMLSTYIERAATWRKTIGPQMIPKFE